MVSRPRFELCSFQLPRGDSFMISNTLVMMPSVFLDACSIPAYHALLGCQASRHQCVESVWVSDVSFHLGGGHRNAPLPVMPSGSTRWCPAQSWHATALIACTSLLTANHRTSRCISLASLAESRLKAIYCINLLNRGELHTRHPDPFRGSMQMQASSLS